MENRNSSKPVLSSICFIVAFLVAAVILFICGAAAVDGHALPPNTLVAGSIALIAAAIAARSVEGR
jgi:uncharacterized membrane protein